MEKIFWIARQELYQKVWSTPLSQLCKEFNLSDNGLRKICVKNDIPLPAAGYWSKIKYGKKVEVIKLTGDGNINIKIEIRPEILKLPEKKDNSLPESVNLILTVPNELKNPDKITLEAKKDLANKKSQSHNNQENVVSTSFGKNLPDIIVSKEIVNRVLLIMDVLIKNFKLLGFKVYTGTNSLMIEYKDGEKKEIYFREKSTAEIITEGTYNWKRRLLIPNGKLAVKIGRKSSAIEFVDTNTELVENKIKKILLRVTNVFEKEKQDKFIREIKMAEYDEKREIENTIRKLKEAEHQNL